MRQPTPRVPRRATPPTGVVVALTLAAAFAPPSAAQLATLGAQALDQCDTAIAGSCETADRFGAALTACDFNADGFTDLAVGVPGQAVSGDPGVGSVHLFYGSPGGLRTSDDHVVAANGASADAGFGDVLTCGRFFAAAFADLAVGAPRETVDGLADAGAVRVLRGSAVGITTAGDYVDQNTLPDNSSESAEAGDRFGAALSGVGPLLAIGVPGEDLGIGQASSGKVHLLSPRDGVALNHNRELTQDDNGVASTVCGGDRNESGDGFGSAVAWAAAGSLVVGAPGEDLGEVANAGRVYYFQQPSWTLVLPGGIIEVVEEMSCTSPGDAGLANGLEPDDRFGAALHAGLGVNHFVAVGVPGEDRLGHDSAGSMHLFVDEISPDSGPHLRLSDDNFVDQASFPGDGPELDDDFGTAVVVGDFDGDGELDVAAGAPGETVAGQTGAGMVNVGYGDGGTALSSPQSLDQDIELLGDAPQQSDHFGQALAAGDFDGNGVDDLAIGVPDENLLSGQTNEGMVSVLYGRDRETGAFGTVQFEHAAVSVPEGDVTQGRSVVVERSGGARLTGVVTARAVTGTASGSDFALASQELTFPAGSLADRLVAFDVLGDTLDEADETFTVALAGPSTFLAVGDPGVVIITLVDDDEGGQVSYSVTSYDVDEGDGSVTVFVRRVRGAASNVTVRSDTSSGTATVGVDFNDVVAISGFGAGVSLASFQVPIRQDTLDEPDETILLALSNPTGGATLGSTGITAEITIADDDPAGQLFADGFERGSAADWTDTTP